MKVIRPLTYALTIAASMFLSSCGVPLALSWSDSEKSATVTIDPIKGVGVGIDVVTAK